MRGAGAAHPMARVKRNASGWQSHHPFGAGLAWNEPGNRPPASWEPGIAENAIPLLTGGGLVSDTEAHHVDEGLAGRFEALARGWREETEFDSAPTQLFMHPAYQEIIGMGPEALPYILRDLAATRAHWFWALRAISGDNPVPPSDRGNLDRMTNAWLAWGEARGLL